jgi:hypothetical protein
MNKNRISLFLIVVLTSILLVTVGLIFAQNTETTKNSLKKENNSKTMKTLEVKNDLQKHGIEVVAPTDFNFDAELRKYVGANESLISLVDSAKPFAFFIKNNSSREVVGISLRWKFSDASGKSVEIPQSEANPGVLMGIKPLDPKMIGQTSLINSKEIKFVSYFNDSVGQKVSFASMRLKNPTINYPYAGFESSMSDVSNVNLQKERIFNDYVNFSLTIDGIVFNDGGYIGADQNFFIEILKGQIQARKDVLVWVTEDRLSNKTDTNILDGILLKASNITANFVRRDLGNPTREQVFDSSYKNYLKNLGAELTVKRTRLSDNYIVSQLQAVRVSDFIELYREED